MQLYKIADNIAKFECDSCLHEHQLAAMKALCTIHRSKLGTLLFGKPWVGKTFFAACLVWEWLQQQKIDQGEMPNSSNRQVFILASRRCIYKWKSELGRVCSDSNVYIWNMANNDDDESARMAADIVVCPLETLIGSFSKSITDKFTKNWLGVLVDIRGLDSALLHLRITQVVWAR